MAGSRWRWTAVAVTGTAHERSGSPCQDVCAVALTAGHGLAAAVADGAGSARLGEVGAGLVAQALLASLGTAAAPIPRREHVTAAFTQARHRMERYAAEGAYALRDLSATGLLAWVTDEGLVGGQVGDGAIVYGLANEPARLHCLTTPATGEYFNETYFLTHPAYLDHLQLGLVEGRVDRLALISDGLQTVSLNLASMEPHRPLFDRLFAFTRDEANDDERRRQFESLLRSERICDRTDDDKTIVIAVRLNS